MLDRQLHLIAVLANGPAKVLDDLSLLGRGNQGLLLPQAFLQLFERSQRVANSSAFLIRCREHAFEAAHTVTQTELADFTALLDRRQPVGRDRLGMLPDRANWSKAEDGGENEHATADQEALQQLRLQAHVLKTPHGQLLSNGKKPKTASLPD